LCTLHLHDLREEQLLQIAAFALDQLEGSDVNQVLEQTEHLASEYSDKESKASKRAQAFDLM
jgi:hypothetical protein